MCAPARCPHAFGTVAPAGRGVILGNVLSYPPGDHWSGDTDGRRTLQAAGTAARETLSPVERLETMLHSWVAFGIMPLFALANAGVPVSFNMLGEPVAQAVVAGFVLGKPLGVVGFAWLAVRPADLGWRTLAGGMLAGIGFTMALHIAGLAFQDMRLQTAKIGILAASLISAAGGLALLAWLGHDRPCRPAVRAPAQMTAESIEQGGCAAGLQHHPSDVPCGTRTRVLVSPKNGTPR
ncbi:MAG: Na+/H+ antiporter NhaA, partial [Geminicoccaceae bacterium]